MNISKKIDEVLKDIDNSHNINWSKYRRKDINNLSQQDLEDFLDVLINGLDAECYKNSRTLFGNPKNKLTYHDLREDFLNIVSSSRYYTTPIKKIVKLIKSQKSYLNDNTAKNLEIFDKKEKVRKNIILRQGGLFGGISIVSFFLAFALNLTFLSPVLLILGIAGIPFTAIFVASNIEDRYQTIYTSNQKIQRIPSGNHILNEIVSLDDQEEITYPINESTEEIIDDAISFQEVFVSSQNNKVYS